MHIVLKLPTLFLYFHLIFAQLLISDGRKLDASTRESNLDAVEDLVTSLPGQPAVKFRHYASYVTVDERNGRALFYWFYEASTSAESKPLVLWLNGGPGCSSVGYGATEEIGPFLVDNATAGGTTLTFNPYSWNNEANLLFVESPIGVGFSYSNTSSDYDTLGDDFTAKDAYFFLQKWFLKFPSYRSTQFYIAGESYAGKYVPELAEIIMDNMTNSSSMSIDLRGIMLGNPETDDAEDWRGIVDYAWSHAIVSDETHMAIVRSCDFHRNDTWDNLNCSAAVDEIFRQYNEIDIYSLYTPVCISNMSVSNDASSFIQHRSLKMLPRVMGGYDPCLDNYAKSYYNRADVQKALHVSDGLTLRNWSICNMTVFDRWSDSKPSMLPIYKKLIEKQLRIWVYSGDTDGRVPVLSTRYSLSAMGLPISKAWRPWYHQKQVAGWVEEYSGFTFVTIRGAGHGVPSFKPAESLALFSSFLVGEALPSRR